LMNQASPLILKGGLDESSPYINVKRCV